MARLLSFVLLATVAGCTTDDGFQDAPPASIDEAGEGKADGTWEAVESLAGLPGTYTRGTFGALPLIALRVDGGDRGGTYEAWWRDGLAGRRFEAGTYSSIEENAAIGFAAITLVPDGGVPEDGTIYAIRRLQREGDAISRLELQMIELPYLKSTMYRAEE